MPNHLCAACAQWPPAQAAGLGVNLLEPRIVGHRARDGGIRGDNAGELARTNQFDNLIERLKSEVRRNLDENGLGLPNLGGLCLLRVDLLERSEDFIQGGLVLKLPKVRRVRRADIDHEEIGVRPEDAEGISVVVRSFFERRNLRLAKVDADGVVRPSTLIAPCGESIGQCASTAVIEAHPIDERLVSDGTKHPRLRIARLRVPCHPPQLAEAEAERPPDGNGGSLLVHACSEAHGVRKAQSKETDGQLGCTATSLDNST